jgi:sugar/nucleoside kinase (ribokinase family)
MKVLIVGSVAYDSVESAAGKVDRALGGAAVYASVAASFYCEPAVVGVVGDDFEEEHIDYLEGRGIDLGGLQKKPGKTFFWAGRYLDDMIGRETLDTQLNVFEDFDPVIPDDLKKLDYLFLANIHPGLQKKVLDQVEGPKLIVMDTMNLWIDTARDELEELFPRVDVLVINDEEARMLTGDYNVIRAAEKLLEKVQKGLIVKRGEHGSTLFTEEGLSIAPAYPVTDLKDPTGAGDSFAGALIGYLAKSGDLGKMSMRNSLIHGAAMASFTVEGFSIDRLREVTREDVEDRVWAIKELMTFD